MENKSNKNNLYLLIIIMLSIFGSVFVAWIMKNGPWGWSDSIAYLVSARNMMKGIGIGYYYPDGKFYTQIIQPPFYPIVIGLIGILRVDYIEGARILDIILFGGTIFLAGFIFYKYSNYPWLSVLACIVLGTFPIFVMMSSSVMTEPLFFFLYFLGLFFLLGYLKHNRSSWLIISGITTGLLSATRYIGLVYIVTGIITIVVFSEAKGLLRFKSACLFGLLGILPLAIFGIYAIFFTYSFSHLNISGFSWNLMISRFADFRANTLPLIWRWIPLHEYFNGLKSHYQYLIIFVILITIALFSYFARYISKKRENNSLFHQEYILMSVFGLTGIGCFGFMIITSIFFQLPGRMDDRQLLPVFVNFALSIICISTLLINVLLNNTKSWKCIILWGIVLSILFSVYSQYAQSINILNLDQGLMSSTWRNSEIVRAVRQMPIKTPIVSNDSAVLLYWADRPAYDMFESLTPKFVGETIPYGSDDTDRAQKAFHDSKGILVIFNEFPTQMSNSFYEQGTLRLRTIFSGLLIQGKYHDGTIYTNEAGIIP